jgi:hypothetical protein
MTPTDIGLIRDSWAAVEPIADTAAGLFYDRLLELDPAIERLFRRTDKAGQRKILMQTVTVVVRASTSSTRSCPPSRRSADGTRATASARLTSRPSARLSCGPSSKGSAKRSRRMSALRGRRRTGHWPR